MSDERFTRAMGEIHRQKEDHAVDIHGKLYTMVQDRIEIFRREFGAEYGIETQMTYDPALPRGSAVVCRAVITDKDKNVVGCGHACSIVGSSRFTTTSPIEVAETSAIGRALASFGLHGGEYASAQEIELAVRKTDQQRMVDHPQAGNGNRQMSGRYVPSEHDGMWDDPEHTQEHILQELEGIKTTGELGQYWNELKPFLVFLAQKNQSLHAEVKASFAAAHDTLKKGKQ